MDVSLTANNNSWQTISLKILHTVNKYSTITGRDDISIDFIGIFESSAQLFSQPCVSFHFFN